MLNAADLLTILTRDKYICMCVGGRINLLNNLTMINLLKMDITLNCRAVNQSKSINQKNIQKRQKTDKLTNDLIFFLTSVVKSVINFPSQSKSVLFGKITTRKVS